MSPKATIVKGVPSRWCDPPVRDSLASQNCGPSKAWQHSSQRKKRDFGLLFRLTASKSFIRIRPNVKFGVVLPRSARFHIAGASVLMRFPNKRSVEVCFMKRVSLLGPVALLSVGLAQITSAQNSGAITGTVVDQKGGVIVGASVQGVDESKGIVMAEATTDRKSTRLNSSHGYISYAVFC